MKIFKEMLIGILVSIKWTIRTNYKYALSLIGVIAVVGAFVGFMSYLDNKTSEIVGITLLSIVLGGIFSLIIYSLYIHLKDRWYKAKIAVRYREALLAMIASKGFKLKKTIRSIYYQPYKNKYFFFNGTFSILTEGMNTVEIWIGENPIVKPGRIYAGTSELHLLLDALADPRKLPLCMNMKWAKPLIEEWVKNHL